METKEKLNLTMLCDFYELTMGNGYFESGLQDRICYFDVFFRKCPDDGGFAIAAGLPMTTWLWGLPAKGQTPCSGKYRMMAPTVTF